MSDPIERLERALGEVGAEHEPPPGWQARVLAATQRRRRWWLLAVPALAAAAIAIVVLRPKPAFELDIAIDASGSVVRGTSAKVGDTLHATTRGPGAHRTVWIYRDDVLLLACPSAATCDLTFATPGTYAIVALVSDAEIPAPIGGFDADLAAAAKAGAAQYVQSVTVR